MKKLIFLCLLLPCIAKAQILNMTNIKQPPNLNPTLQPSVSGTFDLGSNIVGSPGSDFTFTLNGISLTASAVLTVTGNAEVSKDGTTWSSSISYAVAGGTITGQPVTIHNRIKSTAPQGALSGASVQITSSGAPPITINYTGTTNPVPSLSANPTSITGLNGNTGTAGTPQTVSVTFQNSTITATPPTNTEVSQDGGSTWSAVNQIFSTGSPKGVQIRTRASAPTGSISGNLVLSGTNGVSTVNVPVSGSVTSSAVTPDSVKLQFNITSGFLVSGWTQILGDPSTGVISFTIPGTTVTVSTVSTSSSNWGQFAGACIGASNGITNATIPDAANKGVMKEAVLTANLYNSSVAQVVIGGLKTDGTRYDVEMSGTTQYNLATVGTYNVKGASLQTSQSIEANHLGTANTSNKMYWDGSVGNDHTGSGFLPDASGNITIYFGIQSGNQCALLSYIKIWDHSKH